MSFYVLKKRRNFYIKKTGDYGRFALVCSVCWFPVVFSLVLSVMIKISMLLSLRPESCRSVVFFYDPFTPKPIKPIFKIHLFSQKKFKVLFLCFCPTFPASILKLGQVFLCVIPLTDPQTNGNANITSANATPC